MPTVIVNRQILFNKIGENFTDERFDEICFEFGIELDEITSEKEMFENEQKKTFENLSNEVLYKIEVPANRYDLLCIEGLSMALRIFLGKNSIPNIRIVNQNSEINSVKVHESVSAVRPYVLCSILRDITFTNESLIGFMELQDKLHNNICRGRSLVSMGTHDLDTVKGPFTYQALQRDSFKFTPLNRTDSVSGSELLEILKLDNKLKHYTPLLANEENFPVFMDANGLIMSLPPLLNSDQSKLKISTRNVLLEVTAKDKTKANIVLNTLIAMFSVYCQLPFTVEQVNIITANDTVIEYPKLESRNFTTNINYLNRTAGTNLSIEEISKLLLRMGLSSEIGDGKEENAAILNVKAPVTRSDVLHACDIAEDLAISYGYNNIEKKPLTTLCNGYQQPINKLTDLIRQEMAMSGYIECLTMALISNEDMFANMLKHVDEDKIVQIYKSKCPEFEVFRSSLIPGILKSVDANKANQLPFRLFEISDVVLIDDTSETGASNKRRLCFAYCDTISGLEIIQGMVDHIMLKLGLVYNDKVNGYYIEPSSDESFFPDRQACVYVKGIKAGIFGIIHPKVLKNFRIKTPVSLAEIDIEFIFSLITGGEILKGSY